MMESLVLLAQEFEGGDAAGGLLGFLCMIVAVCAISAVLLWGVFKKAGVTPWWSAVPILNAVGLLKVAGRPTWWIILFLIPFVSIIVAIIIAIDIAKKFGRGVGTVVGLILLGVVFYPILGYGSATYDASRTELA